MEGMDVLDAEGHKLGALYGAIIDPSGRRVHYYVLENGRLRRRHYLVPVAPAQFTDDGSALRLASSETESLREFDPETVPQFSDEDLLDAMFAKDRQGAESHAAA
jgi:uncharacterized protein YrrD